MLLTIFLWYLFSTTLNIFILIPLFYKIVQFNETIKARKSLKLKTFRASAVFDRQELLFGFIPGFTIIIIMMMAYQMLIESKVVSDIFKWYLNLWKLDGNDEI